MVRGLEHHAVQVLAEAIADSIRDRADGLDQKDDVITWCLG